VDRIDVEDCNKVRETIDIGVKGETCTTAASSGTSNLGLHGLEAK